MRMWGFYIQSDDLSTSDIYDQYGDATLIESDGEYLLIDTGASKPKSGDNTYYKSNLVKWLHKVEKDNGFTIDKLDIVITHNHKDHAGGLRDVCDAFKVENIYVSRFTKALTLASRDGIEDKVTIKVRNQIKRITNELESRSTEADREYADMLAQGAEDNLATSEEENEIQEAIDTTQDIIMNAAEESVQNGYPTHLNILDPNQETGQTSLTFGDVTAEILGPLGNYTEDDFDEWDGICGNKKGHLINSQSLSIMFTCGNTKYLSCGDIEELEEGALADKYGAQLKSDILKANHHGLRTSSTTKFLEQVEPTWSYVLDHGYTLFTIPTGILRLMGYSENLYRVALNGKTIEYIVKNNKITEKTIAPDFGNGLQINNYQPDTNGLSLNDNGGFALPYNENDGKQYLSITQLNMTVDKTKTVNNQAIQNWCKKFGNLEMEYLELLTEYPNEEEYKDQAYINQIYDLEKFAFSNPMFKRGGLILEADYSCIDGDEIAYEQDEDDCTEGGTLNENGNLYKDYELIETEDPWELFSDDNYELFCFYGSENEKNISDKSISYLQEYFKTASKNKTVLIASHYPLADENGRLTHNADKLIDIINSNSAGRNIVMIARENLGTLENKSDKIVTDNIAGKPIKFTYALSGGVRASDEDGTTHCNGLLTEASEDGKTITLRYYYDNELISQVDSLPNPDVPEKDDTDSGKTVGTGDSADVNNMLWLMILSLAGIVSCEVIFSRRRRINK